MDSVESLSHNDSIRDTTSGWGINRILNDSNSVLDHDIKDWTGRMFLGVF